MKIDRETRNRKYNFLLEYETICKTYGFVVSAHSDLHLRDIAEETNSDDITDENVSLLDDASFY